MLARRMDMFHWRLPLIASFFILICFIPAQAEIPRQVMIEAKVVELTQTATRELGVDWTFGRIEPAGATIKEIKVPFGVSGTPAEIVLDELTIGRGTISEAKLQALETRGELEVLANPRIAVIENMEAKIMTGDEVPFATTTVVGNQIVLITEFKEVGVKLTVTPTILENDYIQLKVLAENSGRSAKTEPVAIGGGETANISIFLKRTADTTVVVKDGETFVIGGLLREEKSKEITGVPFLNKIPILGFFFRYTKDETVKKNLTFFITPRIVRREERFVIPAPSQEEAPERKDRPEEAVK